MCGIFAFLNHLVPRKREEIIKILLGGLKRLEYRGYDSAGSCDEGLFACPEQRNIFVQFPSASGCAMRWTALVLFLRGTCLVCSSPICAHARVFV